MSKSAAIVRRALLRHRRLLAAGAGALAVLFALNALSAAIRPPPVETACAEPSGAPQLSAGMVAFPVRFGQADALAVLSAGDLIDILGQGEAGFQVVAPSVRVLSVPGGGGGLLSGGSSSVLVEVSPEQAAALAATQSASELLFALR
ncbi:MAG: hypothetical protein LBQ92_03335 [Propionibacteriaceae bacterium]|nr:hypothetical protein [Propionibacteriaceae bacterium]